MQGRLTGDSNGEREARASELTWGKSVQEKGLENKHYDLFGNTMSSSASSTIQVA